MRVERRWAEATPSWKETSEGKAKKREKRLGGGEKEARKKGECGLSEVWGVGTYS